MSLSLNQALAIVEGLPRSYAVLMEGNPDQKERNIAWVVAIKPCDDEVLGVFPLSTEEGRKFRLFKRVIKKERYQYGQIVWLKL